MKKEKAFTLAEVLITLGIIGVVAAITIPGLKNNYFEKRTVSQLRGMQSILTQAIKMSEEEYGEVESWGLSGANAQSAAIIAERLRPFIKIAVDCGTADPKGNCVPNVSYKRLNGGLQEIMQLLDLIAIK